MPGPNDAPRRNNPPPAFPQYPQRLPEPPVNVQITPNGDSNGSVSPFQGAVRVLGPAGGELTSGMRYRVTPNPAPHESGFLPPEYFAKFKRGRVELQAAASGDKLGEKVSLESGVSDVKLPFIERPFDFGTSHEFENGKTHNNFSIGREDERLSWRLGVPVPEKRQPGEHGPVEVLGLNVTIRR